MKRVTVRRVRAQRHRHGDGSRAYRQRQCQGIECVAERVLRLDGSVDVVFFVVSRRQQCPSCRDDDQPSADLHDWQRNPKKRKNVGPDKIRPNQKEKAVREPGVDFSPLPAYVGLLCLSIILQTGGPAE